VVNPTPVKRSKHSTKNEKQKQKQSENETVARR